MPSSLKVRPFHRDDRDQLTELVNAHVAGVVPGLSVSVNTVLSQLQWRPEEFIIDPWVAERITLVAEQRQYVIAAAHLLRYRADAATGTDYRDVGVIEWFVFRPPGSFWPGLRAGGRPPDGRMSRAADALGGVATPCRRTAPGTRHLRSPGTVAARPCLLRTGRLHAHRAHGVLLMAAVADLRQAVGAATSGPAVQRTLGECGTRFSARLGADVIGFVEVDTSVDRPERHARNDGLADLANRHVTEP